MVGWSAACGAPAGEGPDHPQCRLPAVRTGVGRLRVVGSSIGIRCRLDNGQRLADLRQASSPAAIGQKAVVANPHQPLGQDMEQEAAHELLAVEDERFVPVTVAVVLDAQGHLVVVHGEDTGVADGDLACVARQVADHRVGVLEAVLAVDHPLGGALGNAGAPTIDAAWRLRLDDVTRFGDDVRLTWRP